MSSFIFVLGCMIITGAVVAVQASEEQRQCGPKKFKGNKGNWVVPFNNKDPLFIDCKWTITVDPGNVVELTLDKVHGERSFILVWNAFINSVWIHNNRGTGRKIDPINKLKPAINVMSSSTNTMTVRYEPFSLDLSNTRLELSYQGKKPKDAANRFSECGGLITGLSGNISSPGFPKNYTEKLKCVWHIVPDPARSRKEYHFIIKFHEFILDAESMRADGRDCQVWDYVDIVWSNSSAKRYCNNADAPAVLHGKSENVSVAFMSDHLFVNKGFSLSYTTLMEEEEEQNIFCKQKFTTPTGTFSSPNFPENYTSRLNCSYTFFPQKDNDLLELDFEAFDVEYHPQCKHDRLISYTESSSLCGSKGPMKLFASGNKLIRFFFETDNTISGSGFKASYKFKNCKEVLKGNQGTFSSPTFLQRYPQSVDCTWQIIVKKGFLVELNFQKFMIAYNYDRATKVCSKDYIEVFSGKEKKIVGRYCDDKVPEYITSTDNFMMVTFLSDNETSKVENGFVVKYKAVKTPRASDPVECGGIVTDNEGIIKSPGNGQRYYRNLNCVWEVKPKGPVTFFRIKYEKINIEKRIEFNRDRSFSGPEGCFDNVTIIRVRRNRSTEIVDESCGRKTTFFTAGVKPPRGPEWWAAQSFLVKFFTDDSIEGKGFVLSYKAVFIKCGGKLTADKGRFTFPSCFLPDGMKCTWTITVKEGSKIKLDFPKFFLTSGHHDFNLIKTGEITVFNGSGKTKKRIVGYHSKFDVKPVKSSSNVMTVVYKTHDERKLNICEGKHAVVMKYTTV